MQQFKKISVNLALVVSLAAFAGVNAQAQSIKLPIPSNDPDIQAVVDTVKAEVGPGSAAVKEIMRQTRDRMKETMAVQKPLLNQMMATVGQNVATRVMSETRMKTMTAQKAAMSDPTDPNAAPTMIAPKFE